MPRTWSALQHAFPLSGPQLFQGCIQGCRQIDSRLMCAWGRRPGPEDSGRTTCPWRWCWHWDSSALACGNYATFDGPSVGERVRECCAADACPCPQFLFSPWAASSNSNLRPRPPGLCSPAFLALEPLLASSDLVNLRRRSCISHWISAAGTRPRGTCNLATRAGPQNRLDPLNIHSL